jgi:hypothetical protein
MTSISTSNSLFELSFGKNREDLQSRERKKSSPRREREREPHLEDAESGCDAVERVEGSGAPDRRDER